MKYLPVESSHHGLHVEYIGLQVARPSPGRAEEDDVGPQLGGELQVVTLYEVYTVGYLVHLCVMTGVLQLNRVYVNGNHWNKKEKV